MSQPEGNNPFRQGEKTSMTTHKNAARNNHNGGNTKTGARAAKAKARAEAMEAKIAAVKERTEKRIAKMHDREKLRARERKVWRALLDKQRKERDDYRAMKIEDRLNLLEERVSEIRSVATAA